jgi:hypothetical protein
MRLAIPKSPAVDIVFRRLSKRLGLCQSRVGTAAVRGMKRGDFEEAQRWVEIGRAVSDFENRVDAFSQEWRRLVKATKLVAIHEAIPDKALPRSNKNASQTPLWAFYTPALKVVAACGGSATFEDVDDGIEASMRDRFTERDLRASKKGLPRWKAALRAAHIHCQKEGWVEKTKSGDKIWKLTDSGNKAVESWNR